MLNAFLDEIQQKNLHLRGIEVYQHGQKIASARLAPNYRYPLHSISKSFICAAIGMLVSEGRLHVRERIVDLFPELAPETPMPYLNDLVAVSYTHLPARLRDMEFRQKNHVPWPVRR